MANARQVLIMNELFDKWAFFEPVLTRDVNPVRDNNASEFKPQNLNLGSGREVNVEEAFQIFAGSFLGRQKTSQPEKG